MPEESGVNIPASSGGDAERVPGPVRVREMQAKLHRWAAADPARRFGDLYNLVCDPGFLAQAWIRVAGNAGANTPGVDRATVREITEVVGVQAFLADLRAQLKARTFVPLPVRQRLIPKPGGSGKLRKLGIPTVADRVVQAALKLVLEPIFEADFEPVSYGFRPGRRAQDAIADIHRYGTLGYRMVVDADIEACFDEIGHAALMDRIRARVADKRVLALVKAFLKAGLLTEAGQRQDSDTGTPQGGILSPLLANIALSVLDEHFQAQWNRWSDSERKARRREGLGTWKIIRYADDFVILVNGPPQAAEFALHEAERVLAPMGLRISRAKTQVVHMSDGFDFLGFRIIWKRKRGTDKWYVYTFVADRPVRDVKRKIRALTRRTSQLPLGAVLERLNAIQRGWANYFKHAVASHTFNHIQTIVWWRVVRMVMHRRRWRWKDVRRWLKGPQGWRTIVCDDVMLFNIASVPNTRYRWRGNIPTPWPSTITETPA
jgi:RNA-directed DNA polymerase